MRRVNLGTEKDNNQVETFVSEPMPEIPQDGARIEVLYAGVCLTNSEFTNLQQARNSAGIKDTSLFHGYEVAGKIDGFGNKENARKHGFIVGDKVIVWPNEEMLKNGYSEYMSVASLDSLIKVPDAISIEVAAMLPAGATMALAAVSQSESDVRKIVKTKKYCDVLIVGAGALGLWTLQIARHVFGQYGKDVVKLFVADEKAKHLQIAEENGADAVIHWDETVYEEYLVQRALSASRDKIHVVFDLSTTERSLARSLRCLDKDGIVYVGGLSGQSVHLPTNLMGRNRLTVKGVSHGTIEDLRALMKLLTEKKVHAPSYEVFPFAEAKQVLQRVWVAEVDGRAILRVSSSLTLPLNVRVPSVSDMANVSNVPSAPVAPNLLTVPSASSVPSLPKKDPGCTDKMSRAKMSRDKISCDKMSRDKISRDKMSYDIISPTTKCREQKCRGCKISRYKNVA